MTNEQIQALEAAAESAIREHGEDWFETGTQVCTVHKSKISLIAAANPAVILSLLAEREADKALIAELKPVAEHAQRDAVLVEQAIALIDKKSKQIHELEIESSVKDASILELKQQYLRLLESRTLTVTLPDYSEFAIVHFTGCSDDYAKGWVDGRNTVNKAYSNACAAAGITLVVGGE